jgi:hypothetical protein
MRNRSFSRRSWRDRYFNHPRLIEKTLKQVLDAIEPLSEFWVRRWWDQIPDVVQQIIRVLLTSAKLVHFVLDSLQELVQ